MKALIITLTLSLLLVACGGDKTDTQSAAMPEEMKESIRQDLANGYALNSVIRQGGTGNFAKHNGGEITMVKQTDTKEYRIEPEWVADAELFLAELK